MNRLLLVVLSVIWAAVSIIVDHSTHNFGFSLLIGAVAALMALAFIYHAAASLR